VSKVGGRSNFWSGEIVLGEVIGGGGLWRLGGCGPSVVLTAGAGRKRTRGLGGTWIGTESDVKLLQTDWKKPIINPTLRGPNQELRKDAGCWLHKRGIHL